MSRFWPLALALLTCWACGEESAPPAALEFTTSALPTVPFRADYNTTLSATGGAPPYLFLVESGRLPDGINLSPSGNLAGIAGEPGTFVFVAAVTDAAGARASASFSLRVLPDRLEIVTRSLPSAREGVAYEHPLTPKGGLRPYRWSLASGTLPLGLVFTDEGHLVGVPTAAVTADLLIRLEDAEGSRVEQALQLVVNAAAPMILNTSLPKGRAGSPYEAQLSAQGGHTPYAWSLVSGVWPAGIQLAQEGTVFGTPTETGDFPVRVRVSDSRGRSEVADLPFQVIAPLRIATPALALVIRNRPYTQQLLAEGGQAPFTWSLMTGDRLPTGLTFSPSGLISGTTSEVGEYPLLVRVIDQDGEMRSTQYTLRVSDRFAYEVVPTGTAAEFPSVCTATTVSYHYVELPIVDSFQIDDLDVGLNITPPSGGPINIGLTLFAPDWASQAVLCGSDGFGGCDPSRLQQTFDDEGGVAVQPERPLSVFDGQNAQGTWRLLIVTISPNCTQRGLVHAVTLSFADDRRTEPYVHLSGWQRNNLVNEPFVHIFHPSFPDRGVGPFELQLDAGVYTVGPNGFREGGRGDDVRDPTPMLWSWVGPEITGTTLSPDGHVSVDSSNVCPGNCNGTGQSQITASGGGYAASTTLRVLPPDHNPKIRRY
jgi:subtilisin-like proprotein convertase family protein